MSKPLTQSKLFIEQVNQLSERTILGTSATLINSFILSVVLWGIVPKFRIIVWFISIVAVGLCRIFLQYTFRKATANPENITKRKNYNLITLAASGVIWGSAGVFLFPSSSIGHQSFIAFVLGGMVAGSIAVFSALKAAFLVFSIPVVLPIFVMFLLVNDEIHYAMGAMGCVFWVIMFITARRMNKETIRSLNLKYENLDLIADLEREVIERKNAEDNLFKRNQQIEAIVQDRTLDLQKVNEKLIMEIEERKHVEKALHESKEKYRELANSLPQIVFELDEHGTLTFVNRNGVAFFGFDEKDFQRGLHMSQTVAKEDRERAGEFFQRIMNGETINGNEFMAQRKDGSVFPAVIHAGPIIRENRCVGVRGIVIDLTKQKNDEEEKKKLEVQLQRAHKMEAIGTLAGGVAHDLNNILSGIVSYPDLLLMQLPEDSPLRTPILTIKNSGNKAAAIVQDLLTLTRRGVVNKSVVNLNDAISEYLTSPEYEKLISFHPGVQLKTNLAADLFNMSGSYIHLIKTVMNLTSNAAEALPDGGEIYISTENRYIDKPIRGYDNITEGDYVVLTVSDTGIGISPKDLERIFEPFFTKKVMGRSGTGLGMAVVWGTVKDHKGYIDVQSIEGKGSTFILYFPITKKELTEVEPLYPDSTLKGKGESVLVVDDVKEQREISSALLSALGYSVTTVSSGEEAIDFLKENPVDLLVLDMIMEPNMDGLATYRKILQTHPNQKAIIASGFSETKRVKEALKLGVGSSIKKPYTLNKLGSAVRTELDK